MDLTLRLGTREDLPAIADLYVQTRAAAVPAMPPIVHTGEEVRSYVTGWDLDSGDRLLWVADRGDGIAGFADVKGDWLDGLYVHPRAAREGIGSALLDVVKVQRPGGFCLWVFESNEPARAFYRRRGLIELERTDGSGNEERSPDVRMAWPGADALAFLRGLIDEVDSELGDLLARRVALTRAVQAAKGASVRDPVREAEIASRVAARVPALEVDQVRAIVDSIIVASLP